MHSVLVVYTGYTSVHMRVYAMVYMCIFERLFLFLYIMWTVKRGTWRFSQNRSLHYDLILNVTFLLIYCYIYYILLKQKNVRINSEMETHYADMMSIICVLRQHKTKLT